MQVSGRIAAFPREGSVDYSLSREVKFRDMTDAPTSREERFFALVFPALERAGYTAYGAQQKLVAATGINKTTVSRLLRGETVPHVKFFPALAKALGLDPVELLVAAEIVPPEYLESQQALSETDRSQVGSNLTPEEVADQWGILDDVGRFTFFAVVDKLTTDEADESDPGDATAQA
ncbi:helix-turn-helix domain-containing protein [Streptomyces sp. NPDC096048]|uniref:helix-turn-helix domain-containing protein n=1 Tax=Streptomyces sp. NPDC096048 TaxID=3366072 RepID=UPI00382F4417